MAGVVNHLQFKEAVDPELFAKAETELFAKAETELTAQMRAIDGFQDFYAIQTSDTEVILVILGDTTDVLDRVATEVGSPWMMANVVPLLARPPDRQIGPTVGSSRAGAQHE